MKRSYFSLVLVMAVAHGAAAQTAAPAPAPAPAPTAPDPTSPPVLESHGPDELATQGAGPAAPPADDRLQRERAELAFQRQSIHFGWHHGLVPLQGDLDRALDTEQFLTTVGRADLAQDHAHRRRVAIGFGIASVAAIVVAGGLLIAQESSPDCSALFPGDAFAKCVDDHVNGTGMSLAPTIVLGLGGLVGLLASAAYYGVGPSDDDARAMADAYNQRLRRQLGLPTATSQRWLHDIKLTPYVARGDAGVMLGARF